jgi:hypothetical protein
MFVGFLLSVGIWILIDRDISCSRANAIVIDRIHDIIAHNLATIAPRLRSEARTFFGTKITGRAVIHTIVALTIILDIAWGLLHFLEWRYQLHIIPQLS